MCWGFEDLFVIILGWLSCRKGWRAGVRAARRFSRVPRALVATTPASTTLRRTVFFQLHKNSRSASTTTLHRCHSDNGGSKLIEMESTRRLLPRRGLDSVASVLEQLRATAKSVRSLVSPKRRTASLNSRESRETKRRMISGRSGSESHFGRVKHARIE